MHRTKNAGRKAGSTGEERGSEEDMRFSKKVLTNFCAAIIALFDNLRTVFFAEIAFFGNLLTKLKLCAEIVFFD